VLTAPRAYDATRVPATRDDQSCDEVASDSRLSYTRSVTKHQDGVPSHYPCVTQKDGVRRVHHPHGDPVVASKQRIRHTLAKLLSPLRA
jgi:hypothetical protein